MHISFQLLNSATSWRRRTFKVSSQLLNLHQSFSTPHVLPFFFLSKRQSSWTWGSVTLNYTIGPEHPRIKVNQKRQWVFTASSALQMNTDCSNSTTKISHKSVSPTHFTVAISCQCAWAHRAWELRFFFSSWSTWCVQIILTINFGERLNHFLFILMFSNWQTHVMCCVLQYSVFSTIQLTFSIDCSSFLLNRWAWLTVLRGSSTVHTARHCPWITAPPTECLNLRSKTTTSLFSSFQNKRWFFSADWL